MQIIVRDNNVDQALRALKKKLQREGVYREMKLRRHYEKPSEKRARERAAAIRRARKLERKRMERDGVRYEGLRAGPAGPILSGRGKPARAEAGAASQPSLSPTRGRPCPRSPPSRCVPSPRAR
jgi:small subunit ribosomal protein S21